MNDTRLVKRIVSLSSPFVLFVLFFEPEFYITSIFCYLSIPRCSRYWSSYVLSVPWLLRLSLGCSLQNVSFNTDCLFTFQTSSGHELPSPSSKYLLPYYLSTKFFCLIVPGPEPPTVPLLTFLHFQVQSFPQHLLNISILKSSSFLTPW